MKKTKKIVKITLIIITLVLLFFGIYCIKNNKKTYIELTQLKTNTSQQMMGYFIKTENGKIIIVDGGNIGDSQNLQNYINSNGGKVDYWFLTHFHTDHTGAISDIINNTNIKIENIIYNFCSKELVEQYEPSRIEQYDIISDGTFKMILKDNNKIFSYIRSEALKNNKITNNIIIASQSQTFEIDNIKIKIISIYQNDIFENLGNNSSMVFKIYVNNKSILFLGDTGIESSEKLLKYHLEDLKSDYVQMAHHGQNGATYELYKEISPHYCLWPTPDWLWDNDNGGGYNSGSWKTLETRKWMENLNVKENYVEKDGDITLKIF